MRNVPGPRQVRKLCAESIYRESVSREETGSRHLLACDGRSLSKILLNPLLDNGERASAE
jgi:hypothetical protein